MIRPDGIHAAADRERELHPKTKSGAIITAWQRRAATLTNAIAEINRLRVDVDALKEALKSRPF